MPGRSTDSIEMDADGYDLPGRPPRLVRLYIRQCLIGFALAAVFVGLLLGFDVAGLRGLILSTQGGWIALGLLVVFNGLVFAGVQFAITIMRMGEPQSPGGGQRLRVLMPRGGPIPRPIPVEADTPDR
ncbi:hypothetical protein [Pararhodobacter sp. SW119]|uniref:hypothetical protein n=1 Tax=Pararhodobacter sp. SW119 TaxID=2780075 RepID=UPI001FD7C90D|nr:hypothetical protein [Pararhodobacter sp. SW119]